MRNMVAMILVLGVSAILLGGCATLGKGTTVMKYDANGDAHVGVAPSSGTYALFGITDTTPEISYPLKEGDQLGFQVKDGQVVSIAGDHTDTWKMGTYYWKKQ